MSRSVRNFSLFLIIKKSLSSGCSALTIMHSIIQRAAGEGLLFDITKLYCFSFDLGRVDGVSCILLDESC